MTKRKNNSFFVWTLGALIILTFSGCHRGYGCPSELGIFDFISRLF